MIRKIKRFLRFVFGYTALVSFASFFLMLIASKWPDERKQAVWNSVTGIVPHWLKQKTAPWVEQYRLFLTGLGADPNSCDTHVAVVAVALLAITIICTICLFAFLRDKEAEAEDERKSAKGMGGAVIFPLVASAIVAGIIAGELHVGLWGGIIVFAVALPLIRWFVMSRLIGPRLDFIKALEQLGFKAAGGMNTPSGVGSYMGRRSMVSLVALGGDRDQQFYLVVKAETAEQDLKVMIAHKSLLSDIKEVEEFDLPFSDLPGYAGYSNDPGRARDFAYSNWMYMTSVLKDNAGLFLNTREANLRGGGDPFEGSGCLAVAIQTSPISTDIAFRDTLDAVVAMAKSLDPAPVQPQESAPS